MKTQTIQEDILNSGLMQRCQLITEGFISHTLSDASIKEIMLFNKPYG